MCAQMHADAWCKCAINWHEHVNWSKQATAATIVCVVGRPPTMTFLGKVAYHAAATRTTGG